MTKPQTRPFPAIVDEIYEAVINKVVSASIRGDIPAVNKYAAAGKAAILQAVRQLIEDATPEEWPVVDSSLMYDTGFKTGRKQGIQAYRSTLLEGLEND